MRIADEGTESVLLASAFGDEDTGGGLFAFDGQAVERLDRLSSNGLALAGDRLVRVIRAAREVGAAGELLVYDERGVERYLRIDELADPHGVAWDGSNYVAVSTMTNAVLWIAPSGDVVQAWRAPGEGDCWHLNSLLVHDGRVFVSAFGRYGRHREWVGRTKDAKGFVLDLVTGAQVLNGLTTPHDPRLLEGAWVVCNSGTAELLELSLDGGVQRTARLAGWTRGIAVSDDFFFVGESANRADLGCATSATIAVLDRDTWRIVDRIALPCREIYDLVLAPPTLVEGVRRGFRTNGARAAEQDQHALFQRVGVEPVRLWATGHPLPAEACKVRITTNAPRVLAPNAVLELECVVENLAGAILVSVPPNPVVLSYRWFEMASGRAFDGARPVRSSLPEPLLPGEALRCSVKLVAPPVGGEYLLRVTLLQERVAWFDDLDESNASSHLVRVRAGE